MSLLPYTEGALLLLLLLLLLSLLTLGCVGERVEMIGDDVGNAVGKDVMGTAVGPGVLRRDRLLMGRGIH